MNFRIYVQVKRFLTILLFFTGVIQLQAQGEYNNWCFGLGNTLDFNSGFPVLGTNSLSNPQCNATISDGNGNLLFYTQKDTVWDASHNVMQNGTGINSDIGLNAFQAINILPVPCQDSLYYIFSLKNWNIYYSIVNTNLNNGLGAVVQKNILLDSNVAAGFAMTRHGNNTGYWITYQKYNSNIFYSRSVSSFGISPPVISQLGPNITYTYSSTLEFSPSGETLINTCTSSTTNFVAHYDFNNNTGTLSNFFQFSIPVSSGYPVNNFLYSQFSPDLSKLYVSGLHRIYQFDYSSGNPTTIANSGQIIYDSPWPLANGIDQANLIDLALGPDGIIYISRNILNRIGMITQPNALGVACNYVDTGIVTPNQTGGGFPTFIPNLNPDRTITYSDSLLCQYDTLQLGLADTTFLDSVHWSVYFPTTGVTDTNTLLNPTFIFNDYGLRAIECFVYSGCRVDTTLDTVVIHPTPVANLGNDTILCEGENMQLQFNDTTFNYLWSTGDSNLSIPILQTDTYWVAISSICGVASDTIVVDSLIPALVHLPNDTLLCIGDTLYLDAAIDSGTYVWNTGDTFAIDTVHQAGFYTVTATNFCGTDSDSIQVDYTRPPLVQLGNDTVLCQNDTLFLDASDTLSTYLWYDGDTIALDTITTTGVYWVTDSNMCGVSSDTIQTWFVQPPTANLGADTVICIGDTIQLSDTTLFGSYQWSTNQTTDTIAVYQSGTYSLTVTNVCGSAADTLLVETEIVPTINLGNDTLICQGDSVILDGTFSRSTYQWSTGATDSIIVAYQEGIYTVTTTNMCGLMIDSFYLDVDSNLTPNLGPDTILCTGDVYTLNPQTPADSYLWSTGSTADSITIQTEDNYTVSVSNVCGTFTDEVNVYYDNSPITNLGPDSTYCLTDLVELDAYWSRATYLWNTGQTDSAIIANNSGQYWVEVTNLCGYDDDTVRISYIVPISFDLGSDTTLCMGEILQLGAPAHEATYQWNTGETDSTITVNQPDYYTVSVSNLCGTFSDGIRVYYDSLPQAKLPDDTILCEDERISVTVDPQNATQMEWSMGGSQREVTFTEAGSYVLTLSNHCGETRDTLNIAYQPSPEVNLGSDTIICLGEEIELKNKVQDSVAYAYEWSDGSEAETLTINQSGEYSLTVTDSIGCEGTDVIWVEDCGITIYIPNAFTPNGDGMNDIFKVEGDGFEEFDFSVFNRWGEKLFQTQNPEQGWDGTYRNEPVEIGVYSYRIWVEAEGYASKTFIGKITLVK